MTKRLSIALAAIVLVTATAPALARDRAGPKIDCENAFSTYEINACADRDYRKADKKLNRAYQDALRSVDDVSGGGPYDSKTWTKSLRTSQRAWIGFRDAECKGHTPKHWGGGTATTSQVLGCMKAKTEQRTRELTNAYDRD